MSVPVPTDLSGSRAGLRQINLSWIPPALWVAVGGGAGSTTIVTSRDAVNWASATYYPFTSGGANGIAWNGSYWFAVGSNGNSTVCIAKSSDGMTWTDASNNPFYGGFGMGIAWNGSYWVAVGKNSGSTVTIAKSFDGMTWTNSTNNPFSGNQGRGQGIAWNGSYWIAIGFNGAQTVTIVKSTNGMDWTNPSNDPFTGGAGYGIAWNGSYWIAVGANSGATGSIAKSADGMTWTDASNNPFPDGAARGIAWNGSYWVAGGNNSGATVVLAKSSDGMTWTNASNNPFTDAVARGIAWYGKYWIACGASLNSSLAYSTDGITWTLSNTPLGLAVAVAVTPTSITGFRIQSGGLSYTLGPYEMSKAVTGLTPATSYTFTIQTDISGSYSTAASFGAISTQSPPPPTDLAGAPSYRYIDLSWTAPVIDITGYRLSGAGTTYTLGAGLTTKRITDLSQNTTYSFTIQTDISGGYSTPASFGAITTLTIPPPTNLAGVGRYNDIDLSWTAPVATITGYRLSGAGTTYTLAPGLTTKTITNLSQNTTYTFTIQTDISGFYSTSASFGAITTGLVPAPIVKVRPRVAATELQFWWSLLPPQQTQLWVAGGYGTNRLAYSTNGINWTTSTSGNSIFTVYCYAVAYGNGVWVAGGYGNNSIAYSTNAITWTASTSGNNLMTHACNGIAYGGGLWVAGGSGTNKMTYSTNGITWTASTSGNSIFTAACNSVAYGNAMWVAVGNGINSGSFGIVAYSTNGVTWTSSSSGNNIFTGACYTVAYGNGTWVIGGQNNQGLGVIAYSINGYSWYPSASGSSIFTSTCKAVAYGNGLWVAGGEGTNRFAYSVDSINWTVSSSGNSIFTSECRAVSYVNGLWVAGGSGTNQMAYSTNGIDWTESTSGNTVFTSSGIAVAVAVTYIPITGYILESASPALSYTVVPTETTKTVTGLTTDTNYSFTLKTDISGNYSAVVPFRTVRTSNRPQPVATLTKAESIVNGELDVTFSWTNPGDYSTYYVYGLKAAAGTQDTIYKGTSAYSTLSKSFTGLDPVRAYVFHIQRGNDAGYSTATSITTTITPFDPTTVAGLNFWVDAADVSGNGATVADGARVGTWKDKSGNSRSATAATAAVLRTDSVGRYLDFQGSTWYNLSASSWAYNQYYTIFIVDKPRGYNYQYSLMGRQSASTDSFYIQYNTSDGIRLSSQGDNAAFGTAFENLTAPVNVWCFTNYGGKTVYWNKQVSGKNPVSAAYITDSLLTIGAKQAGSEPYYGRMREILMYTGVMSETNREAITTYLYNKWFTQPALIPLIPVENSAIMWLDGADITTFFQDTAGTVPVTADGQGVRLWKDKSGFGNNMTATPGATYEDRKSLATGTATTIQTANYLQTGDATLFLVFLAGYGDEGASSGYFIHDTSGNFGLRRVSAPYNIAWAASTTVNNNRFTPIGSNIIFYGTMKKGQLTNATFIDHTGAMSTTYAIDTLKLVVGTAPIILSTGTSVDYNEVIYYNRCLTDAEIQQNAAYLSNKWGIAIPTTSAFVPTALTGLQLWLDSSDPSTLLQTGGVVTAWNDKSGLGNNAVPYGSPTVNSGVVFNGSSQYFSLPNGALPLSDYSYYAVSKFTGDSVIVNGGSKDISGQMWVAVADNSGNSIATSFNGLNWTPSTNNPFSGGGSFKVAWNGSYWVAVGRNSMSNSTVSIAKSLDGVTWSNSTNNPFTGGIAFGIAWNGSYWLAAGNNSAVTVSIAKSTDGMTWTDSSGGGGNNPFTSGGARGIAWNGSYWVAVGNNSSLTVSISKSVDGMTWTDASNNPFYYGGYGIAWNGSYWIAVGNNANDTVSIVKSSDGITWTNTTNNPFTGDTSPAAYGIAWNGSYWIAVGRGNTGTIAKSTDGMTWMNSSNNPFSGGNTIAFGIAWNGSYWVAVGRNSNTSPTVTIAKSSDGMTWTVSTNNPFPGGNGGWGIATGTGPLHNSMTTIKAVTTAPSVRRAQTVFDNSINGIVSSLTDINDISGTTTVIVESLYDGSKSLFLSGITGSVDTSTHIQDSANNFVGKDLSGNYMNGTIKELLVYNVKHTTTQRQQVETYLKSKWYPNAYTPTGTALWLDASGSANFTLSGTNIQSWNDKSASVNNFTQSAVWGQPIYSLDPVTGRYGVKFAANAIANGLSSATSPFGATSSWSVFTVQRYDYSTNQSSELVNAKVCTSYNTVYSDPVPGWLAVSNDIATSTDGINWENRGTIFYLGVTYGIAWNGSYWVAVGRNGAQSVSIAKSTNGVIWTNSTNNPFTGTQGRGIAWNGSYWVAVGQDLNATVCIAKSLDGLLWTDASSNPFTDGYGSGIAWNGSYWVAVGSNSGGTVCITKSTDGMTWTVSTNNPFAGGVANGIARNGSYWVAVGYNGYQTVCIAKSSDGMTWTDSVSGGGNNPFSAGFVFGIAWNGSYWVAVGQNGDATVCIAKSTDGMTWTDASNNPFSGGYGNGIAWNGSYWIAVGNGNTGTIAKSTDGMTWTNASSNPFSDPYGFGIGYGNILPTLQPIRIGTDSVSVPSTSELKMFLNVTSTPATVEIHTKPVLTSQVVNSLVYSDFYNGISNASGISVGTAMSTAVKLNIGYTGSLTPALAGAMRGYIYELIVFKTTVNTATRQSIEGYLAWKWGIQNSLPTTHPYYLAPP